LPKVISELIIILNRSRTALINITNVLEVEEKEVEELLNKWNDLEHEVKLKLEELSKMKPWIEKSERPITSEQLKTVVNGMEREVKNLLRRAKRKPPQVLKEEEKEEKEEKEENDDDDEEEKEMKGNEDEKKMHAEGDTIL